MAELLLICSRPIESVALGGADHVLQAPALGLLEAVDGGGPAGATAGGRAGATVGGRAGGAAGGPAGAAARSAGAATAVGLAGVLAGCGEDWRPGDVLVASEIHYSSGVRLLPSAPLVAAALRRTGLVVRIAPLAADNGLPGAAGSMVVDEQAGRVAAAYPDSPMAVVRSIGEGDAVERAVGSLFAVRVALQTWARACRAHTVLLASPRSFCAGVERAIETVRRALDTFGAPVYVRRQIVHNTHVVRDLAARGAVFVSEVDDVPEGATLVLAAHGVSPAVRRETADRPDLRVIDATCPLVAKVHTEARRYATSGHRILLVGHAEHEEVVGTVGEAPERIAVVASPADVEALPDLDGPVAYLTQTTLAMDETASVVAALKSRFPTIKGPPASDICYASENRQKAVRRIAPECDLVLVVGSANSSNTARLAEVARRQGCRAELIEDAADLRLGLLDGVGTIGITAGASVPDGLVMELIDAISGLGPLDVQEQRDEEETVHFALPTVVR
ncbi:MAG TPA: 4-hydroxy-3-methylbut-2-enyl diphosphate reductase [Acidimicrobiales bacterium]|nr:4-hydroxy-3-methylbut-2-enyl diphosphate reductase [Acidimicrobiales bacterium]